MAQNVAYPGIPLMDGTADVVLQGVPPLGGLIDFDLPDTTQVGLGFDTDWSDLATLTNAVNAVFTIDTALDWVAGYREELRDVRDDLRS